MRELIRGLVLRCLGGILARTLTEQEIYLVNTEIEDLDDDVFDADELGIDPEERFDA